MTKVYIVVNQPYVYADDCGKWDGELKYALTENWEIKGVFKTKDKAEALVRSEAEQWAEEMEEGGKEREASIKHETDYHYYIEERELN